MSLTTKKVKMCCNCKTTDSPKWRKGPPDQPVLCNACGVQFKRKGTVPHFWNTVGKRRLIDERRDQIDKLFAKYYYEYKNEFRSINKRLKDTYVKLEDGEDQEMVKQIIRTTKEFAESFHLLEGFSIGHSIQRASELSNRIHEKKIFEIIHTSTEQDSNKFSSKPTSELSEDNLENLYRTLHDKIDKNLEATVFREQRVTFWDSMREILTNLTPNANGNVTIDENLISKKFGLIDT